MNESLEEQRIRWTAERQECLAHSEPYEPGEFVPGCFSVGQRDTHHFDVYAPRRPGYVQWYFQEKNPSGVSYPPPVDRESERAFCIRGEPGAIYVRDERWDKERKHPRETQKFATVESAMAWIAGTLLLEPYKNRRKGNEA
jgi:hypothetical protein